MPSEHANDYSPFKGWPLGIGICNVVVAMVFVISGILKHDGARSALGVLYALGGILWLLRWRKGGPLLAQRADKRD